MAATFPFKSGGKPAMQTEPGGKYRNLAGLMTGMENAVSDAGNAPGGIGGGKPGQGIDASLDPGMGSAGAFQTLDSTMGMNKAGAPGNDALPPPSGYSGPTFTPGQTLTVDQLPDYQRWMAAGMPGTPAAQLPRAAAPGAAPAAPASPNGYSRSSVGDTNPRQGMEGLPGIDTTEVDYNTLPGLDTDFNAAGTRVRDALFGRVTGLLNPEHERARSATASRLANQGIVEGSQRWNEEMDRLDQQRSLSLERAGLDADIGAGDEMSRLFTQALATRQQMGGERERGADRRYTQTLGARGQLAGERLTQGGIDAQIAAANAQAGATASGHALQAAQMSAANDINRSRLGLDSDEQDFTQWLRAGQFARGGVNMPNFGTPIPLDVTGAAGAAGNAANSRNNANASRNAGYWSLAGTLLNSGLNGKGGGKVGYK